MDTCIAFHPNIFVYIQCVNKCIYLSMKLAKYGYISYAYGGGHVK